MFLLDHSSISNWVKSVFGTNNWAGLSPNQPAIKFPTPVIYDVRKGFRPKLLHDACLSLGRIAWYRRLVDAHSAREWSSEAAAQAVCPNSLRWRCSINEETGSWLVCDRTNTLVYTGLVYGSWKTYCWKTKESSWPRDSQEILKTESYQFIQCIHQSQNA